MNASLSTSEAPGVGRIGASSRRAAWSLWLPLLAMTVFFASPEPALAKPKVAPANVIPIDVTAVTVVDDTLVALVTIGTHEIEAPITVNVIPGAVGDCDILNLAL